MLKESRVRDDPAAWSTFEEEAMPHATRLFQLAMWLERNRADAEDAVQETMVHAMRSFHRYQPGTNCRAWLITILRREHRGRARLRTELGAADAALVRRSAIVEEIGVGCEKVVAS